MVMLEVVHDEMNQSVYPDHTGSDAWDWDVSGLR